MALNYNASVNISAEFSGQRAVDQAKKSFGDLQGSIKGVVSLSDTLKGAIKGFVAGFAVDKIVQFGKGLIDNAEQLDILKQKTGIGVQALSDLRAVAEDNGVNFEELEGSLKKFSSNLGKARSGISEAVTAFRILGISQDEIRNKSPDQILLRIADRFSKVKDGADKTAAAVALFGRAGADVIPVLNGGSKAIENMGLKISDDVAKQAHEFNDELNKMSRNSKQVGIDILSGILPSMNSFLDKLLEVHDALQKTFSGPEIDAAWKRIDTHGGSAFDYLTTSIAAVSKAFKTLFTLPFTVFGGSKSPQIALNAAASAASKKTSDQNNGELDTSALNPGVKATEDRIRKIQAETRELGQSNTEKKVAVELAELESRGIQKGTESYRKYSTALTAAVQAESLKERTREVDIYLEKADRENDLRKIELEQVNYSTEAYKELVLQRQKEAEQSDAIRNFKGQELKVTLAAIDANYKEKRSLIELEQQQKQTFSQGAKSAFKDYIESAQDTAAQTKELFGTALHGIEDAMVELVKKGKLSFASLADALETELLHIAFAKAIAFGLSSVGLGAAGGAAAGGGSAAGGGASVGVLASAHGNVVTQYGAVALKKYAAGGVAHSPMVSLFGEGSQPEAYVPLADGRSIPVTLKGASGGSGGTAVSVTVNLNGSSSDANQATDANKGKQLGNVISAIITQRLIQEKKPGGLLA